MQTAENTAVRDLLAAKDRLGRYTWAGEALEEARAGYAARDVLASVSRDAGDAGKAHIGLIAIGDKADTLFDAGIVRAARLAGDIQFYFSRLIA